MKAYHNVPLYTTATSYSATIECPLGPTGGNHSRILTAFLPFSYLCADGNVGVVWVDRTIGLTYRVLCIIIGLETSRD